MSDGAAFAEIIPLLRLPRSLGVFDYTVPEDLGKHIRVGELVRIPFRSRATTGIVLRTKNSSTYATGDLKPITKILDPDPIVDPATVELLHSFATDCFISPGLFLRSVLPDALLRAPPRISRATTVAHPRSPTLPTALVSAFATAFSAAQTRHPVRICLDDSRVLLALISKMASESRTRGEHLRILTPFRTDVLSLTHFLNLSGISASRSFPTDGKQATYALWRACQRGEIPVLVGTRATAFFPLPEKSTVLLLDEASDDWKQSDINPRYDGRAVAHTIAQHRTVPIVRITHRPFLPTNFSEDTDLRWVDARVHRPPPVTMVNLRAHAESKSPSVLSDELLEAIQSAKKSLLYVHRRGRGSVLICRDCHYRFSCPTCEHVLAVHRSDLRCTLCDTRSSIPLSCPNCHGSNLKPYGTGTERVEDDARRAFPAANIARIDRDTVNPTTRTDIDRADIVIGTEALFRVLSSVTPTIPLFNLIAIADADTMLHRPDFRAHEKLADTTVRLSQLAARSGAPLFIQTLFPDLALWKTAAYEDEPFLAAEHAERQSLHYPPYYRVAKLIFQGDDRGEVEKSAGKIAAQFQSVLREHPTIEIVGPFAGTPPRVRGQFHYRLIVRFPPKEYAVVKPHLTALPDSVIVDLDPTSIL